MNLDGAVVFDEPSSFRKRFMKKLTLDRVVPIISERVSWLIVGITFSGLPSLPNCASSRRVRASRFSLELKSWSTRSSWMRALRASRTGIVEFRDLLGVCNLAHCISDTCICPILDKTI